MKWNAIEFTGIVLFIIGFYGLISRRKVVKSILSLGVMDVGVVLFFVLIVTGGVGAVTAANVMAYLFLWLAPVLVASIASAV